VSDFKAQPILAFLFQKFLAPPTDTFQLDNEFTFNLVNGDDAHMYLFHYVVSHGNVLLPVSVFGVNSTTACGPLSNVDLVHFVWENFIRFSYKKFALVLSPRLTTQPELLFVKHYRVESDAWKDTTDCDACVEHHQAMLLPYHACDLSDECPCTICTRQPPTLAAFAQHVLFNYTLHIDRFRLDVHATHDRYVYAARSNRVPRDNLLPPKAPAIGVWFYYDIDSPFRFHRDCEGAGPWSSQSERLYDADSPEDMVDDLIRHKNHFWCHHCGRGLFFPLNCMDHADTEPF
jgi:hypothetical protein